MKDLIKLIKCFGWFIKLANARKQGAIVLLMLVLMVMGPQWINACTGLVGAFGQLA